MAAEKEKGGRERGGDGSFNEIVKYPKGDDLRVVEKDVLIPKIMREKAMKRCSAEVKEFEDCMRGRTISAVWACQKTNKQMQDCLTALFKNEEFQEECKREYLQKREEYRRTGIKQKDIKMSN
ncbi:PREDICTED: COX assembly mitochondrial protein homolog [Amphimedon queenslandica]|uniref:COX assembly mitochondrial protein n=1 Tax=Amphimedon queenslandica TaxID=400682 RepID=A0A1X7V0Z9_AMPQE|nr:PREDICTED: COX assembly mitochondrial protein homolog [Amphimedon queenslandica]|eukprot:XP_003386007.2 PREDICTED: COX assembly mitochondrial protein homolog [Amphimedon queenslandica]